MASLLSSVTATSADVSRKRKSSPDFPSSDPAPDHSSESSYVDSRKRYGEEEDEDLWGYQKKPRVSDMTATPYDDDFGDPDMGGSRGYAGRRSRCEIGTERL